MLRMGLILFMVIHLSLYKVIGGGQYQYFGKQSYPYRRIIYYHIDFYKSEAIYFKYTSGIKVH